MDLPAYTGKKVLITGHTGFKGAWLTAFCHHLGAEVLGYALSPTDNKAIYSAIGGDDLCHSVIDDIRNVEHLRKVLYDFEPDYIFHLAAQALVLDSYTQPSETFDVNILGTSYLLESLINYKKKCSVVVITTDKVYENKSEGKLYVEGDRLGGHDPYSTSKACCELVVSSYNKSFFFKNPDIKVVTARAGNVIGGGDYSVNRIIPDFIRSIDRKEPLLIRNPESIRPWQHVLEPLSGYLRLGLLLNSTPEKLSDSYNFGPLPKDHLTVEQIIKLCIKFIGSGSYQKSEESKEKLHESTVLKLSVDLAKKELGWNPVYDASQAIKHTIEWYKADNKKETTFLQIRNYINALA